MAHSEAPSFSLGLDFSLDPSPPHSPITNPPSNRDDLPDLQQQQEVPDSDPDPDTPPDPTQRVLKRLRRGPPEPLPPPQQPPHPPPPVDPNDDEDIEEFSSQDQHHDQDEDLVQLRPHSSTWSSSKVSLNGCGALTPGSSSRVTKRKRPCSDDVPASSKMETGKSGLVFPKLTTSPLRRFQLIDSDSDDDDDDSLDEVVTADDKIAGGNQSKNAIPSQQNLMRMKFGGDHDLWKDFDSSLVKSFSSVPTPAFNAMCEEYFRSAKNKVAGKSGIDVDGSFEERCVGVSSSCQGDQQVWESATPVPPSHQYFFHEDPRIRQLVRSRLCNFSPLGVSRVNQQPNVSHIDYMGQFGNEGASGRKGSAKSSTRGNNKSRNLTVEESFDASGGWVDPKVISPFGNGESSRKKATKRTSSKNSVSRGKSKMNESSTLNVSSASTNWVESKSCTSMPKDAGKRRVQASGQSTGHWFTSGDGRKVYVNKSGQELTGRIAYRQYRKESGAGVKKSRKKTGAKKTNAKKKN